MRRELAPLAVAAALAAATLLAALGPGASAVPAATYAPVPPALFTPVPPPTQEPTVAPTGTPAPPAPDPSPPRVRQAPRAARAPTPGPARTARPAGVAGAGRVQGVATWYCDPAWPSPCTVGFDWRGAYAAAGPALRAALGPGWRGRTVLVNGVAVRLIDVCACGGAHVIDVYHAEWLSIPHPDSAEVTW